MITLKIDPAGSYTLSGIPGAILSALIRIINSLGLVAVAEPNLPGSSAWTHVKDALPENGARVVMMRYTGRHRRRPVTDVGRYTAGHFCSARVLDFRPTHWMPLPDAPPDEQKDFT